MQALLYHRYAPKMYGVCLRYASCADEANDMLQEGFIKIFSRINSYRGDGPLEAWMRRIITNTAIEHLRKKTYMQPITETEEDTIEDNDLSVLDTLSQKDIINLIQTLPTGYRTVFNLKELEGHTHKEIAKLLDISEGTSKSQFSRARMILQEKVKTYLDKRKTAP